MMDVGTMRTIDRYVGVPLCWLTGVAGFLFRKATRAEQIRSVLIIKFFGMGSILLSTPFLNELRKHFPAAKVYYLTFESNEEILRRLPFDIHILSISTASLKSFITETLDVLRTLRSCAIDVVFDLEFFSKFSTLISVCAKGQMRVGFDIPTLWRRSNLTHPVTFEKSDHVTHVFLRQLNALGISTKGELGISMLAPTQLEMDSMVRKLALEGFVSEIVTININAGATSLERRWSPDRFVELAIMVHTSHPQTRFVFIGNSDERAYVENAINRNTSLRAWSINAAGLLTIGELIALLKVSRLLITNDSGPMHLATATSTPTVALFGPESPQFYGPGGPARVVFKAIACSPCLNVYNAKMFKCPYDARCMREISVAEVFEAIHSLNETLQVANG